MHIAPRGIYRSSVISSTRVIHSISYPSYRGFTISADSLEALLVLVDSFWCPANGAGITSIIELNRVIQDNLENTAIIHIENKAA